MAGPTGVNARTSDGIFPSLGSIQAASYLRAGSVVKNYQDKLDYFISETDEGSNIPISGTTPQLYANPEVTTPGTGETNTASNIGVGDGPFAQKVASDLQFNSESYDYGIESQLLDNTYYRGLNPFIADNIGSFVGDMVTSRTTPTTIEDRSGFVRNVAADRPAYGVSGLSAFDGFTNILLNSEVFTGASWSKSGSVTITNNFGVSPDLLSTSTLLSYPVGSGEYVRYFFSMNGDVNASVFVRSDDLSEISLNAGFGNTTFQLSSNWQRINISGAVVSDNNFSILSNSPGSIEVWGAQITETSHLCPYAKTELSQISIAAESSAVPSIANMPTNGGDLCFVIDANMYNSGDFGGSVSSTDGSLAFLVSDSRNNFAQIKTTDGTFYSGLSSPVSDEIARFTVRFKGGVLSLFKNGNLIDSTVTTGDLQYDYSAQIRLGARLNSYMKIKKWLVNESLTDAQILELGGPDNVIL